MTESGPLSAEDQALLGRCQLPALERHHLSLLAHCLRTLQEISGGRQGPVPPTEAIESWASLQPAMAGDPSFQGLLVQQLQSAAAQLEQLAAPLSLSPLELKLEQLIEGAMVRADSLSPQDPPPG